MMKKLQKKKNNKGFSLVELIVVIAIMAILVGVLAPTIMGQIEKSRYSKDIQALDGIYTALQQVVVDETAGSDLKDVTGISSASGADLKTVLLKSDAIRTIASDASPLITKSGTGSTSSATFSSAKFTSSAFKNVADTAIRVKLVNNEVIVYIPVNSGVDEGKYPAYKSDGSTELKVTTTPAS